MPLWDDVIDPAEITGYARGALADLPQNESRLAQILPNRYVNDIEWTAYRGSGGLAKAAQYRSYDTTSRVATRPRAEKFSGELPPISEELRLGEYELLKKRANPDEPIREQLIGDGITLAKRIETRQEMARGEVLATGKLAINENRVITTIDFGRRPDFTTSVGTWWDNTVTSQPIDDLLGLCDLYEDENGVRPGAIVISRKAIRLAMASVNIRGLFTVNGFMPTVVTQEQLNAALGANDLPPLFPYRKQVEDGNGVAREVISWKTAILTPAPVGKDDWQDTELGATFYGETAEASEYAELYNIASADQPGVMVGVHKEDRPVAVWTNASAISAPVLANPNLTLAVKVAA